MAKTYKGKPVKWQRIGNVLYSKDMINTYVKFSEDVSFRKGDNLVISDPRKQLDLWVSQGILQEDVAEARKSKIPEWVKFDLLLPPPKESK